MSSSSSGRAVLREILAWAQNHEVMALRKQWVCDTFNSTLMWSERGAGGRTFIFTPADEEDGYLVWDSYLDGATGKGEQHGDATIAWGGTREERIRQYERKLVNLIEHVFGGRNNPARSSRRNPPEELDFRTNDPQQFDDRWAGKMRTVMFTGKCSACSRRTYGFLDEPFPDFRGVLGDHTNSALQAEDYEMTGPDVPLCAVCANESAAYRSTLNMATRQKWKPKAARSNPARRKGSGWTKTARGLVYVNGNESLLARSCGADGHVRYDEPPRKGRAWVVEYFKNPTASGTPAHSLAGGEFWTFDLHTTGELLRELRAWARHEERGGGPRPSRDPRNNPSFAPGTLVGADRRPASWGHHPGGRPWSGVVLSREDPRAWRGTLYAGGRQRLSRSELRAHVAKHGGMASTVPVLWEFGKVYWEKASSLRRYHEEAISWRRSLKAGGWGAPQAVRFADQQDKRGTWERARKRLGKARASREYDRRHPSRVRWREAEARWRAARTNPGGLDSSMPAWWKPLVEFDRELRVGSHVKVRWGYGGGFRVHGLGRIVKLSPKSVQVKLDHQVPSPGGYGGAGWPAGHVLTGIPRPSFEGLLLGKWNEWLGVMPPDDGARPNPRYKGVVVHPGRIQRMRLPSATERSALNVLHRIAMRRGSWAVTAPGKRATVNVERISRNGAGGFSFTFSGYTHVHPSSRVHFDDHHAAGALLSMLDGRGGYDGSVRQNPLLSVISNPSKLSARDRCPHGGEHVRRVVKAQRVGKTVHGTMYRILLEECTRCGRRFRGRERRNPRARSARRRSNPGAKDSDCPRCREAMAWIRECERTPAPPIHRPGRCSAYSLEKMPNGKPWDSCDFTDKGAARWGSGYPPDYQNHQSRLNPGELYIVTGKQEDSERPKSWGPAARMFLTDEGTMSLYAKRARRFDTIEQARSIAKEYAAQDEALVKRCKNRGDKHSVRTYYDVGRLTPTAG